MTQILGGISDRQRCRFTTLSLAERIEKQNIFSTPSGEEYVDDFFSRIRTHFGISGHGSVPSEETLARLEEPYKDETIEDTLERLERQFQKESIEDALTRLEKQLGIT